MLAPMPSSPRKVVIVAFPDVQMLDVVGPAEVFGTAERLQPGRYQVELVARARGPLRTSSGIPILPRAVLSEVRGPIDTLIVAGGVGVYEAAHDRELVAWVKRRARTCRRVASVCSGAFLLAEAGLLDGRRATTHWAAAENLAERYPRVTVDADPIFIRDGNVWTSAGVAAGIDLSLALVTDDHGPRVARAFCLASARLPFQGASSKPSTTPLDHAVIRPPLATLPRVASKSVRPRSRARAPRAAVSRCQFERLRKIRS